MRTPANGAGVSYVVPYVGTWIEICIGLSVPVHDVVVPYVGTWIEIFFAIYHSPALQVVPYVGNVDRNDLQVVDNIATGGRSLRGKRG